ncbi:hypothetical protein IE81DRAFT_364341 [Ceraceosorus guamensis]|uniref:Uncharacterized protein n=1 Tax=Ceraceosorus guamensis TaxID=1522189 RepID=A0A316W5U0_9BASI|nr:hypothetical protein IE81DRAFT_364341 [Ceraceosorus guamensis]PWN45330.1 hypothetical protein IE81DRAFT_364341 [Ceraceosorus guamensis]
MSSGRKVKHLKIGAASGSRSSAAAAPTTMDEALEAGIEHEERGERFHAGAKAERAFNEAVKAYAIAAQLDARNAIPLYNLARVHFVLATQFQLPPESCVALQQSLQLYDRATQLSQALPEMSSLEQNTLAELPDAFALDVKYNLHAAQQSLAELLEESQRPVDEETIVSLYSSAAYGFISVGDMQRAILDDSARRQAEADRAEEVEDEMQEEDASSGHMSTDEDSDGYAEKEDWTASPVTPATTLETFLSAHSCLLSILSRSFPAGSAPHSGTTSAQTLERAALDARDALARADQLVLTCPNPSELSDEGEWEVALANLQAARRAGVIAEADRRSELASLSGQVFPATAEDMAGLNAIEGDVSLGGMHLLGLASTSTSPSSTTAARDAGAASLVTSQDELVRQACDLADQLLSLSVIRTRRAQNADCRKQAWEIASLATKLFQYAHGTLLSRKAGALGAIDASTSAGRARANISCSLSSASLLRGGPAAAPLMSDKSKETLLDNARIFARRALVEIGLSSSVLPEASGANDTAWSDAAMRALQACAPQGGWEGTRTTADAILAAVRATWARQQLAAKVQNETKRASSSAELAHLTRCVQTLLRGAHAQQWAVALALDPAGPRRIVEEGWECASQEGSFWVAWQQELL